MFHFQPIVYTVFLIFVTLLTVFTLIITFIQVWSSAISIYFFLDNGLDINGDILSGSTWVFASIFHLALFLDLTSFTSKSEITIPIFY